MWLGPEERGVVCGFSTRCGQQRPRGPVQSAGTAVRAGGVAACAPGTCTGDGPAQEQSWRRPDQAPLEQRPHVQNLTAASWWVCVKRSLKACVRILLMALKMKKPLERRQNNLRAFTQVNWYVFERSTAPGRDGHDRPFGAPVAQEKREGRMRALPPRQRACPFILKSEALVPVPGSPPGGGCSSAGRGWRRAVAAAIHRAMPHACPEHASFRALERALCTEGPEGPEGPERPAPATEAPGSARRALVREAGTREGATHSWEREGSLRGRDPGECGGANRGGESIRQRGCEQRPRVVNGPRMPRTRRENPQGCSRR